MKFFLVFCLLYVNFLAQANDAPNHPLRLYIDLNQQAHVVLIDAKTSLPLSDDIYQQVFSYKEVDGQYIALVKTNKGTWGYMNAKGKWLHPPVFDEIRTFSDDKIARVKKDNQWGFLKSDGSFLVEPQYHYVTPFNQGFAAVQNKEDGDYYYINRQAKKAFDHTFSSAQIFADNGLAAVATSSATPVFEIYSDKVVKSSIKAEETWGYINTKGEMVIQPQFNRAQRFNQFNIARVRDSSDNSFIVDNTGIAIDNTFYEFLWGFSESGVAWSESTDPEYTGYIDTKGKQVWEASYHDFSGEYNGLLVKTRGGYTVYDPFGKLIIKEESTWAFPFVEPEVTIALRDHWGLLHKDGRFNRFSDSIIAPLTDEYTRVIGFKDGLIAMINENREIVYFDKKGQQKYRLSANDKGLMSLFDNDGSLIWENKQTFEKVHAVLAPGVIEHFENSQNNNEEFVLQTINTLLQKEPKRYFVPNLLFDSNTEPYILEGDIDDIRKGAIEIIANTYVNEEQWGSYEYLSSHNSDAFDRYTNTLKETITKKYGKPNESKYGRTTWTIKDKTLSLELLNDSGDGDFYYQLVLEVN